MKSTVLFTILFVMIAFSTFAQVPRVISYQGYLSATGAPVNGMRDLEFKLYGSETDLGPALWTETHLGVHVQNGVFSVFLGSANPFGEAVDFSRPYYLGISIDSGPEMTPRFELTASPYALNIPSMGAEDGQVLKWNAAEGKWVPGDVSPSSLLDAGDCQGWNLDGEVLYTADDPNDCSKAFLGVAKGDAGNSINGVEKTHVNLGASSITGAVSSTDSFCTIGGGLWNTIGETGGNNVICGGRGNYIDPFDGSGGYSTIVGGSYDTLEGSWQMAFGRYVHDTTDYRVTLFECTYSGQLFLNHDVDDGENTGVVILVGCEGEINGGSASLTNGGVWTDASSRTFKDRYVTLDAGEVLSHVKDLEIVGWHYIESEEYHIWPFAEDFYDAFGTGIEDSSYARTHIASGDIAGVGLVAIQELSRLVDQLRVENAELRTRIEHLESSIEH